MLRPFFWPFGTHTQKVKSVEDCVKSSTAQRLNWKNSAVNRLLKSMRAKTVPVICVSLLLAGCAGRTEARFDCWLIEGDLPGAAQEVIDQGAEMPKTEEVLLNAEEHNIRCRHFKSHQD